MNIMKKKKIYNFFGINEKRNIFGKEKKFNGGLRLEGEYLNGKVKEYYNNGKI